jgi:hypothetical protein
MANFTQLAIQKIKDMASSLGKSYNNYKQSPFIQSYQKNINQPIYNATNALLNRGATIPRFQISRDLIGSKIPATKTPVGQLATNIILGIPESIANIPRNLTVGYSRLAKENLSAQQQFMSGQKIKPNWQNIATGIAPLGEAALDIASFGTAGTLAKQGGKELAKGGIGQAFKQGAKAGALYGGVGGLAYGTGEQYGKKFNVGEVAGATLMGVSLGGLLGGGVSGAGAVARLFKYDDEVLSGLRNFYGEYKPGQKLVKPPKMPQAQWDFQLKINKKLGRNPYQPIYPKDLQKTIDLGLSVKKLTKFEHDANVSQQPSVPSVSGGGNLELAIGKGTYDKSLDAYLTPQAKTTFLADAEARLKPLETYKKIANQQLTGDAKYAEIDSSMKSFIGAVKDYMGNVNDVVSINGKRMSISDAVDSVLKAKGPDKVIKFDSFMAGLHDASTKPDPIFSRGMDLQYGGDPAAGLNAYVRSELDALAKPILTPPPKGVPEVKLPSTTAEVPIKTVQSEAGMPKVNQGEILSNWKENTSTAYPNSIYQEGKPVSEAQQFNEWNKAVDDYANGITRGKNSVSVEPTLKTQGKIKTREVAAQVKTQKAEYNDWQKQVFGEANARTTTKAIDDLGRQMKTSTNQGVLDNADVWKDKPRVALTNETMERNFTDVAGKDAPVLKDKLIEPVFKAEAERTRFLNKERTEIKALDIKPRSVESKLVQELGEGKITAKDLPKESAGKIIKAESVLRQKYDSYLTKLNEVLVRNGYDPIPKRKDYFHHFEELNGVFDQMGVSIKATDLPTDINGLSADFKPGKTFFNAALQRKGTETSVDAITGIDKYLEGASKQIYLTDSIQKLRSFETAIREKYAGTDHLSNFVADLTEYTNGLAGKKAMLDRAAESLVGRRVYAGANLLKKQTGANMVGFNVASAATNTIPIVETLATTNKISVAQAMLNIFKNTFKDDGFIDKSDFLTSRLGSDRLSMNAWDKAQGTGYWIFKTIDTFTSQLVVRSKYLEGLSKGLSEEAAMKSANTWGRKLLAGRTAGEMPTLYNSKTAGFLTQFQLEVNNQWSFMTKDIPREFSPVGAASALGQLFIYSYIYNNLYEKMFGRRPAIDPIGVSVQAYQDYTNPNMKKGQATKNLAGNIVNQLPYIGAFTGGGRIPVSAAIPNPFAVISGDSTWQKEVMKPITYLLPPTGGSQAKKLIEGTTAYSKGASIAPAGGVRFPIPQTLANFARTAIGGQYSTPEARTYFREGRTPLGANQTQEFMQTPKAEQQNYYNDVIKTRQSNALETKADNEFLAGGTALAVTGNIYRYKDINGDLKKINTAPITSMKSDTNYQKALKEDAAYKLVDNILDSGLKPEEQSQALKDLGISMDDASYYNIARQNNDLKSIYINDEIGRITAGSNNRADLLNYLIGQRKVVNGDMVLADTIVTQLNKDGVISDSEATMLKNLKIVNGVKTKLSGRGKKVTIKKVSALPASKKVIAPEIKTMEQLLTKSGKIRAKKQGFITKIK